MGQLCEIVSNHGTLARAVAHPSISSLPRPKMRKIFLSEVAQESDDVANYVIGARIGRVTLWLNAYPYTGGHLMVVPYKQAAGFARAHG